ncbi:hypothetical protein GOP47_0006467 [Adiantum capillus-veneris]|uniref:RING-type domain-containing protein n=1 Tax=Adiantum capillus-veneris TaxID=13818 RepID=A0A9D4V2X9_ADICA|nr:hypothetical protein GOP47_0006467 [Adiantum capillus-veneris]
MTSVHVLRVTEMVETKVAELPVEVDRPGDTLGLVRSVVKENHGGAERKHYFRRRQRSSSISNTDGVLTGASNTSDFCTASPNAVKKLKEREIEIPDRNYVDLTADSPHNDGRIFAGTTSPELSFLRRHHRSSFNRPKAAAVPNRSDPRLPAEAEILALSWGAGQTTEAMRGCTHFRTPGETRNEVTCNKERANGRREAADTLQDVGTSDSCFGRSDASREKKDKEPVPLVISNQVGGCSSGPEQVLVWKRKRSSLTDAGTSRHRYKPPRRVRDGSTSGSSFGGMERPIDVDSLECPSSSATAERIVSAAANRARQIEEDEMLAKFLQEDYGLEAEGNFALDDAHLARMLQEEENARYTQQRVEPASQVANASIMQAARREMQRVLPTIRSPAARPTASSSRMRILRNLHNRSRQQIVGGRRLGGSTMNPSEHLLHFPEGLDLETRVEFLAALETVSQGSFRMLDQVDRDFNEDDYEMLLALDDNNHSHSGASYSKIEQLPISVIKPTDVYEEMCSICLEIPVVDDVVRRLPCMHGFHLKCIDEWLGRQANCPICKMEI